MKNYQKILLIAALLVPIVAIFAAVHVVMSDESGTTKTLAEAGTYCNDMSTAPADPNDPNDTDWRLPGMGEIVTFGGTADDSYVWTTTMDISGGVANFHTIRLDTAAIMQSAPADPNIYARCVRNAP